MHVPCIRNHVPESGFTRIDNTLLLDSSLSAKAKFILIYLLSKPPDWLPRLRDIANHCKDGMDSIKAGLWELRRAGYAQMLELRGPDGRILDYTYRVSSRKEFSSSKSPETVIPRGENPSPSKTENSKTQETESDPVASSRGALSPSIPSLEEVNAYVAVKGYPLYKCHAWYATNQLKQWRTRFGPMNHWRKSLDTYVAKFKEPVLDSADSDAFWKWAHSLQFEDAHVNAWIRKHKGANWQVYNSHTQRMEPITDFKKHCQAWCMVLEQREKEGRTG